MKTFGVELEYDRNDIGFDDLKHFLRNAIDIHDSTDTEVRIQEEGADYWTVKEDGSCGHEITTPALKDTTKSLHVFENIIQELETCISPETTTNRCGMHVHIGTEDFVQENFTNLFNIFKTFEPAMFEIWPGRNDCSYIDVLGRMNMRHIKDYFDGPANGRKQNGAYHIHCHDTVVNLRTGRHRKTVEVRYAAGTTKTEDIINWVKLILCLVYTAERKHLKYLTRYNPNKTHLDLCNFICDFTKGNGPLTRQRYSIAEWIQDKVKRGRTTRNSDTAFDSQKASEILSK